MCVPRVITTSCRFDKFIQFSDNSFVSFSYFQFGAALSVEILTALIAEWALKWLHFASRNNVLSALGEFWLLKVHRQRQMRKDVLRFREKGR